MVEGVIDNTVLPWRVREVVQTAGTFQIGIVFLRQTAINAAERYHAAKFELVDARNTVQYPAFEEIGRVERHIFVHHKLHRLHLVEGALGEEDTRTGLRYIQFGERRFLP